MTTNNQSDILKQIIYSNDLNCLSVYNYRKCSIVNSKASKEEYIALTSQENIKEYKIGIISLILPEYLCIEGKETEIYEILDEEFSSFVRIDQKFYNYGFVTSDKEIIQIIGSPEKAKEYKENNFNEAYKLIAHPLRTLFSIIVLIPNIADEIKDTVIKRSIIRKCIKVLNKFSDCYKYINNIPSSNVPHYSFNSFDCAYIKEFDATGQLINSEKYLLNPARLYADSLPHFVDPDKTVLNKFKNLLVTNKIEEEYPLLMFKKGLSYLGNGHDIVAIKFCVSAVESLLRSWAIKAEEKNIITFRQDKNATQATIKELKGKFQSIICDNRLVEDINKFVEEVNSAIDLRHSIEHRNNYELDSAKIQNSITVLDKYFSLIQEQYTNINN